MKGEGKKGGVEDIGGGEEGRKNIYVSSNPKGNQNWLHQKNGKTRAETHCPDLTEILISRNPVRSKKRGGALYSALTGEKRDKKREGTTTF